jgi:hypothetical protein
MFFGLQFSICYTFLSTAFPGIHNESLVSAFQSTRLETCCQSSPSVFSMIVFFAQIC